jgi:ferritin-like metal-binding protein YciE
VSALLIRPHQRVNFASLRRRGGRSRLLASPFTSLGLGRNRTRNEALLGARPAASRDTEPTMDSLKDLFEETLKDVYFAENAILKALPKMEAKATSPELKRAFRDHLKETKAQVERLDEIFELVRKRPEGKELPALKGLMQEAEDMMGAAHPAEVVDAGLIACAQAVEHYEIARYGSLIAWAEQLQFDDAIELLEETLEEEETADERLTELAIGGLNERGAEDDDEYDDH